MFTINAAEIKTKDISSLFSEKQIRFTGDASLEQGVLLDMDKNLLSRLYDEANFSIDELVRRFGRRVD